MTARTTGAPSRQVFGPDAALIAGGLVAVGAAALLVVGIDGSSGIAAVLLSFALFGGLAGLVLRRPAGPRAVPLVLAFAALCQLPGLAVGPRTSTDAYRYVWDGRVALSGVSPYRYVPLADELAPLRDPVLFPGLPAAERSGVTGKARLERDLAAQWQDDPRTRINRPRVPTIYPPAAQLYFTSVAAVTPWGVGTFGLQVAAALLAAGLTALLALGLRRAGRDPRAALLWGWCPLVVLETGNGAHLDALVALLVLGTAVTAVRRPVLAGILFGAAIATKLVPLLLAPALLIRSGGRLRTLAALRVPLVAVGVVALGYFPFLLTDGRQVAGFLPGYLVQEGYAEGRWRYASLGLLLPPDAAKLAGPLLAVVLAALAVRRAGREPVAVTCCWLYGAALLVSTPAYPWYCLPLIALAVLAGRPEWFAVPLAAYLAYATLDHAHGPGLAYLAATLVVLAVAVSRRRSAPPPGDSAAGSARSRWAPRSSPRPGLAR